MSPSRLQKLESGMRLVLAFHKAFNRHDVPGIMQLMTEDCILESSTPAPEGTVYSGKEAVTQFWQNFFQESPQAQLEIEEVFGLGNHCIMRWKYSWVDAAGTEGRLRGVDLFQVKDDLIYERLSYVKG